MKLLLGKGAEGLEKKKTFLPLLFFVLKALVETKLTLEELFLKEVLFYWEFVVLLLLAYEMQLVCVGWLRRKGIWRLFLNSQ